MEQEPAALLASRVLLFGWARPRAVPTPVNNLTSSLFLFSHGINAHHRGREFQHLHELAFHFGKPVANNLWSF